MNTYYTYLAGGIEHCTEKSFTGWRTLVDKKLRNYNVKTYNPIEMESIKTKMTSHDHISLVNKLKKEKKIRQAVKEMLPIWMGDLKPPYDLPNLFNAIRNDFLLYHNTNQSKNHRWGDYEGVLRSDFIIFKYDADKPTWGTPGEIELAYMFKIPIFCYTNDIAKINSTALMWVILSSGKMFDKLDDLLSFVIKRYKLSCAKPKDTRYFMEV